MTVKNTPQAKIKYTEQMIEDEVKEIARSEIRILGHQQIIKTLPNNGEKKVAEERAQAQIQHFNESIKNSEENIKYMEMAIEMWEKQIDKK